MPILTILNQGNDDIAKVEHNAQVNKIESIQINGVNLAIENKKISLFTASNEDISTLFKNGDEMNATN